MYQKPIGRRALFAGLVSSVLTGSKAKAGAAPITMDSLLDEMVNRDVVARLPDPTYVSHQASSYDRCTMSPEQPGWFANNDWSHFIREEKIHGRTESVMMEAAGPGVITRFWMGAPVPQHGPTGTIRIYLDGSDRPVLEQESDRLLSGTGLVAPPLSAVTSIGRNFYFPIPFASGCKVTYDRPNFFSTKNNDDRAWYVIEYRSYPRGIEVKSFSQDRFHELGPQLERIQRELSVGASRASLGGRVINALSRSLAPGKSMESSMKGPAALRSLKLRIQTDNLPQALRSTVISMTFDNEDTVWCPVGDFFGSGVGLNPYHDWWRGVNPNGEMSCDWVMPYQRACKVRLTNLGKQSIQATLGPHNLSVWEWDDRSLLFHSYWRQQYPFETKEKDGRDWNFIEIQGKGVYVGDTFAIHNGSSRWWGEGDEKIFVDGESFPSHIGTGTEDYYGYSFGDAGVFFEAPFHAQPRAQGNNHPGHTTNTRTRSLDAIPFTKSLRFDMEVWHWAQTTMALAATTYWYGKPGTKCNREPDPAGAAQAPLT